MMEQSSKIAILGGTGAQGNGLALRLARAGHQVIIGSRDAERARTAAAEASARVGKPVAGGGNRDAAAAANIVILTVPYAVQRTTVEDVRDRLAGKILIDATVPLMPPRVSVVQLPDGQSAVAALQELLGKEVQVVSAFQNVSAQHLADLEHEIDCDVLVCGDDATACARVIALCADIGLRGLHAGPIRNSAAAEALTSLLIAINRRYKVAGGAGIRITGIPN
jgi:NADPH-dependent F420 reductase